MPRSPLTLRFCLPFAAVAGLVACRAAETKNDSTGVLQSGGSDSNSVNQPGIALPVAVERVRDGDLVLSIMTSGQVRAERQSELKAEVAGTVQQVAVRPGDFVRRGQSLVELDRRPFDLAVRQREADVDRANLAFADLWLPDSIATGRSPGEERKRAARIRSGLDAANLALEQAKLDRERATIIAPFDGIAEAVAVAEGERIGAGQLVTRVVDVVHLRVEAAVLEHDIPLIREGGIAIVSSSASPDATVRGEITAILASVDTATHAGRAYVRLPSAGALRPGMTVDVRLEARRLSHRRLVPKQAVIERDGRPLVFVVRDNRAEWVYIRPGRDNGIDMEVLADSLTNEVPVRAGDLVITRGHLTLTHQAMVRVVEKNGSP